jgi:prepilin-type N-terminal cleavage/methylation domain-containing protein
LVRSKKTLSRAGFTLIELVFAIVIMSIGIVSLPIMMQISSDGADSGIVQEAIFAGSAELMGATSYYWDGRSTEDFAISGYSRVIDVDGDCDATTRQRPGHVNRRCLDSNAAGGANYTTADATLGLNASVHADGNIFDNADANAYGYKELYTSQMQIAQGNDINGALSNNVKVLTVLVSDATPTLLTSLNIRSANIGEVEYYKRRF